MELDQTFPKKLTAGTVALTLCIIVGLGVQQWNSLKYIRVLKVQHIPTTELSGMIIHVDDVLTDAAYLSLLTGQARWEERYEKYKPALDYSTKRFTALVETFVPANELQQLKASRNELFEVEASALDLGKKNKVVEAFQLLDSENYSKKKRTYTSKILNITGRLAKLRSDELQSQYRMARFTFFAFLISLAALIATGVILIKVLTQSERQRKKMYSQLAHASRLASLGTLSSGIAHELRSPLTVVKGLAQHMEDDAKVTPAMKSHAREIVEQSNRIELITTHLRSFAREGESTDWKPLSLNESIVRSMALLTQQFKNRGIELELSLADDLPLIDGDSGQLESVFQNLITNSRDAFEEANENRPKIIQISSQRDGAKLRVTYRDNGKGIPNEIKDQIFDPFFTTKGGKGMGLGLSIVHGIVERHKGTIEVNSTPGEQTTFVLTFPVSASQTATPKAA